MEKSYACPSPLRGSIVLAFLATASCTMDFDQFQPDGFLGAQASTAAATGAGGDPVLTGGSASAAGAGGQSGVGHTDARSFAGPAGAATERAVRAAGAERGAGSGDEESASPDTR